MNDCVRETTNTVCESDQGSARAHHAPESGGKDGAGGGGGCQGVLGAIVAPSEWSWKCAAVSDRTAFKDQWGGSSFGSQTGRKGGAHHSHTHWRRMGNDTDDSSGGIRRPQGLFWLDKLT